jgi:hypothetical protein
MHHINAQMEKINTSLLYWEHYADQQAKKGSDHITKHTNKLLKLVLDQTNQHLNFFMTQIGEVNEQHTTLHAATLDMMKKNAITSIQQEMDCLLKQIDDDIENQLE